MKQIIIYGTVTCSKCTITKQLLSAKEVPFEFIDLDNNPDIMEKITAKIWPQTSLPVIQIGDELYCISSPQEVLTLIDSDEIEF